MAQILPGLNSWKWSCQEREHSPSPAVAKKNKHLVLGRKKKPFRTTLCQISCTLVVACCHELWPSQESIRTYRPGWKWSQFFQNSLAAIFPTGFSAYRIGKVANFCPLGEESRISPSVARGLAFHQEHWIYWVLFVFIVRFNVSMFALQDLNESHGCHWASSKTTK